MASLSPLYMWDRKQSFNPDSEIMSQLEKAKSLFQRCGDIINLQLVHLHTVLFNSLTSVRVVELAYGIGSWAHDNGVMVYALHFSLLALRMGNYFRYKCAALNEAKGAYETSRIILHHLPGFHIVKYQARESLAGVLLELGDYRMAKIVVDDAKVHIQGYYLELQGAQSHETELVPVSKAMARHFTKRLILTTLRVYSKLAGALSYFLR